MASACLRNSGTGIRVIVFLMNNYECWQFYTEVRVVSIPIINIEIEFKKYIIDSHVEQLVF